MLSHSTDNENTGFEDDFDLDDYIFNPKLSAKFVNVWYA